MILEFFSVTDTGRARRNNEDSVAVDEPGGIAVLADGMGGYNAGEVASGMASERVRGELGQRLKTLGAAPDEAAMTSALLDAVDSANREVYDAAMSHPEYAGMGTTLVVAVYRGARLWLGHIGDSRGYRFRNGHLEQLTRDHSLLQEQIDAGLITAEQAAYSMHKNLVTRAVGVDELVDLEIHDYPVEPGDILLMCSDGLSDMLSDEQIEQLLRTNDSLPTAGAMLVQAANAAGGRDNIAVILARAKPGNPGPGKAWWSFWR
ncbi:MAG TPA: Stp1/IreP family PP2C-type Ser/Thr phosphatase [Burkholderiaceae bacterium]|jgi:protein phosphatase|nr:Stp1/IreP family PP2C-type Ser/Thr phosphatase [Burkholderiaceae bacterium]